MHSLFEKERKYKQVHHELDDIFRKWTLEEFNEIQNKIDTDRRIDPELWI